MRIQESVESSGIAARLLDLPHVVGGGPVADPNIGLSVEQGSVEHRFPQLRRYLTPAQECIRKDVMVVDAMFGHEVAGDTPLHGVPASGIAAY